MSNREIEVVRDEDGNVISEREIVHERPLSRRELRTRDNPQPPKTGGMAGFIFALALVAAGIGWYAYSQGSFQNAGADADQMVAEVQQETGQALETTGDALETTGDNVEQSTDQAADTTQPSETGSN